STSVATSQYVLVHIPNKSFVMSPAIAIILELSIPCNFKWDKILSFGQYLVEERIRQNIFTVSALFTRIFKIWVPNCPVTPVKRNERISEILQGFRPKDIMRLGRIESCSICEMEDYIILYPLF